MFSQQALKTNKKTKTISLDCQGKNHVSRYKSVENVKCIYVLEESVFESVPHAVRKVSCLLSERIRCDKIINFQTVTYSWKERKRGEEKQREERREAHVKVLTWTS